MPVPIPPTPHTHIPDPTPSPENRPIQVADQALDAPQQALVADLQARGVEVDVLASPPPSPAAAPRIEAAEDLGPMQLWRRYGEVAGLREEVVAAGIELLTVGEWVRGVQGVHGYMSAWARVSVRSSFPFFLHV
jgi:hypothetical protein